MLFTIVKAAGIARLKSFVRKYILRVSTPDELVADATNWSVDPVLGMSSSKRYTYLAGSLPNVAFVPVTTPMDLSKLLEIKGVFTGYYDTPTGAMGYSLFRITLSTGKVHYIGTLDENTAGGAGQGIYDGQEAGVAPKVLTNCVGQELSFIVPEGATVTALDVASGAYDKYPRGQFGFKDIEFTLRT